MPDGIKYLMKMSLFLLMNCDVFCSGFPDFPEAIPFLAKYIARTNQNCAKGTGNKSHSIAFRGVYKTTKKYQSFEIQVEGGRISDNLRCQG